MSRAYQKPPIVEAVCEFRFQNSEAWDSTIPGLLYGAIRKEFPQKRDRRIVELRVHPQQDEGLADIQGESIPRVQFLTEDGQKLVQISPGLLSVNVLAPYPRWPNFKALIFWVLDKFRDTVPSFKLSRLGLRYINQISVQDDAQLHDLFRYGLLLPDEMSNDDIANVLLRSEHDYSEISSRLQITLAAPSARLSSSERCILDLDFFTTDVEHFTLDASKPWIEMAHEKVESAFEAVITDRLRREFKETYRETDN